MLKFALFVSLALLSSAAVVSFCSVARVCFHRCSCLQIRRDAANDSTIVVNENAPLESTTIAAAAAVTAFTTLVPPPSNATLAAPARVAVEPTTVDVPAIARVPTTRVNESRLLMQPVAEQTRSRIELPADLSVDEESRRRLAFK